MAAEQSTDAGEEISTSLSAGITFLSSGNIKRALAHLNMAAEVASILGVSTPGVDASGLDLSTTEKRRLSITDPALLQLCAEVYYYQAMALQQLKVYTESIKSYKLCVNISLKMHNQYYAALCFIGLAECHQELGDPNNEVRNLETARHLYREIGEVENEAYVCIALARAYLRGGQEELCMHHVQESGHLCQRVPRKRSQGELLSQCGWIYSNMKMFEEALVCWKQTLSFVKQNSHRAASILQNIGAVYNEMKLFSEALDYHQQAAALYERSNKPSSECKCLCNLALAQCQLGDNHKAITSYTKALTRAQATNDRYLVFQASEGLGAIHFALGEASEAEQFFKEALSVLDSIGDDTGLARERVMEKLSCVLEAATSNPEQQLVLVKKPKPLERSDSVDADLTAYMTGYDKESSAESSAHEVVSVSHEVVTLPAPPTPVHVKEGSLALGERAREVYTTITLPAGDPTRPPVTQVVSLEEPVQFQTTVHTNNTSSMCTLL